MKDFTLSELEQVIIKRLFQVEHKKGVSRMKPAYCNQQMMTNKALKSYHFIKQTAHS